MRRSRAVILGAAAATALGAAAACIGNDPVPADPERYEDAAPPLDANSIEDAGRPDDADAGATTGPCNPDASFEPPSSAVFANINTGHSETGPYLSPDELTIYFSRTARSGTTTWVNIFEAKRKSIGDVFDAPTLVVGGVNTANAYQIAPVVTADAKKIFFARTTPQSTYDIWLSERGSEKEPWGAALKLPIVSGPKTEFAGDFLDGVLWLSSDRQANGKYAILRAPPADGGVGVPATVTGLDDGVSFPRITRDGKRLFFSKSIGGVIDIWTATVDPDAGLADEPATVANVNSVGDDFPGSISKDGCRLYMTSDRGAPAGSYNVYVAERRKQ